MISGNCEMDARQQARLLMATVVDGWKENFRAQGVKERDLEMMAQYIDGPFLKGQRAAFC